MAKGMGKNSKLVSTRVFVRRKLQLEGMDLEIAKLYQRAHAVLTTDERGEPCYCFILTQSTTLSDNLSRQIFGELLEFGELVANFSRGNEDEDEGEE